MPEATFVELLAHSASAGKSVCVGLDSDFSRLPKSVAGARDPQLEFNRRIIDATADLVAAYKPNSAFYEARGADGVVALIETARYIRSVAPNVPVVLDAKRGDIGSTNDGYVEFVFETVQANAVTLHPFLGSEAAAAFLADPHRGAFVLCRTSNPGAGEFQDLNTSYQGRMMPLYEAVACTVRDRWNERGNCGLVVGATYPSELRRIRELTPSLPLLIPGIGAQGGDIDATVSSLAAVRDAAPVLVNSSRQIIFASSGDDFDAAARQSLIELHEALGRARFT